MRAAFPLTFSPSRLKTEVGGGVGRNGVVSYDVFAVVQIVVLKLEYITEPP